MNGRITKSAQRLDQAIHPTLFYRSARAGMQDFLQGVSDLPARGVLLPAYIGWSRNEGSGVFDPISNLGVRHGFYGLNADLSADLKDIERRLHDGQYRVVVLIHYFGRTDRNLRAIRELTDRHNALLVEDLAHGFFSALKSETAGRTGHLSLYSLHKMFPLEDGGMVVYTDPSLIANQVQTRPELANRILEYDWKAIAAIRRRNFFELTAALSALPQNTNMFDLIWPDLGPTDVPQSLPVRIIDGNRDEIYSGMNADGFGMVSLYHTLIEQIPPNFSELKELAKQITNFPVHQDVSAESIGPMVDSFQRHLLASRAGKGVSSD